MLGSGTATTAKQEVVQLKRVQEENMELKAEIARLENELLHGIKNVQTLKNLVMELQEDIGKKEYELLQKNRVIGCISSDLEKFGKEMDAIISYFELLKKDTDSTLKEELDILKSRTFGLDRDLLFGINVDTFFLKTAALDTVRYYLATIGCTEHIEFEFKELVLKSRHEFELVAKAFTEYIKRKSSEQNIEIIGVLQIHTRDLFHSPRMEFWGNDKGFVRGFIDSFIVDFNLSGELEYAYFEID